MNNGFVTVQIHDTRRRDATSRIVRLPAKVTPKRIKTMARTWDRTTGKQVSAYRATQRRSVLLGYETQDQEWVLLP